MTNRSLRAIDISFSGVRWVEVSDGPEGAELVRWGVLSGGKAEPAAGSGSPGLPDRQALSGLFSPSPSRSRKGRPGILLSLPSGLSTTRFLRLPATGEAEVRAAVEFEVREALEIEGDGLYWDFLSASEDGTGGKGTRVLAVATLAERVQPYLERLREAGLPVHRAVPDGVASFWALQACLDEASREHVLLLDIGPMESVLTLGSRWEVIGSRSVPAGSRYSEDTFWREVGRTVEFFRERFAEAEPRVLYLVGEAEPGECGECAELTGVKVQRFHPGAGLRALRVAGDLDHEELKRFAAPLGLVAAELGGRPQINLLPSRERRTGIRRAEVVQRLRSARRFWPAVVLAALIALTWAAEPALIGSARRGRLDRAGEVAAKIQDLSREKGWLDRIASKRLNWSELFLGLSDVVPGNVNITEISFNEDGEVRIVGNMGGNLANLADFIGSLEEKQVLKDARIEKSASEERKLNFVVIAEKGAGKFPEKEVNKAGEKEEASPSSEREEKPAEERVPAESPPGKPAAMTETGAKPEPSSLADEEAKTQAEEGRQDTIRNKEEKLRRARGSRRDRRSSGESGPYRVISDGEGDIASPYEVPEDIARGGGP